MKKDDAINAIGSGTKLADICGITPAAVSSWPDIIPEPRASQVREAIRAKIVELQELVK